MKRITATKRETAATFLKKVFLFGLFFVFLGQGQRYSFCWTEPSQVVPLLFRIWLDLHRHLLWWFVPGPGWPPWAAQKLVTVTTYGTAAQERRGPLNMSRVPFSFTHGFHFAQVSLRSWSFCCSHFSGASVKLTDFRWMATMQLHPRCLYMEVNCINSRMLTSKYVPMQWQPYHTT